MQDSEAAFDCWQAVRVRRLHRSLVSFRRDLQAAETYLVTDATMSVYYGEGRRANRITWDPSGLLPVTRTG